MGLFVADSSQDSLYNLNGDQHFIPASITKLITTAAILNAFSPNYKFHTQILADADVGSEGVIDGNLYLKGGGDPAFVSEKMWMLVNDFLRSGVKKVTGHIYVDDSYLDDEMIDPGREADRNDRAYDAPVSGLSFNWDSTTIFVRPGKKVGDKAAAWVDPANDYVTLVNGITTAKTGTDLVAERKELESGDQITVSGKIGLNSEEKHIYKNVTHPALYAGVNFKEFLRQRGVDLAAGSVSRKVTPSSAKVLADEEGEPLSRLITDMNKFSNNFIAETLAKDLGAFKSGKQGHMGDGLNAVRDFLKTVMEWDEKDFSLQNVSGFTRKNSFTPKQFIELLGWLQRQFNIYPEFLQSIPVAGIDGTLGKRMKDSEAVGWVRAKTGLLNGVVALSGLAGKHGDGVRLFTFIYNGHGDEAHVREVFDSLATALVK